MKRIYWPLYPIVLLASYVAGLVPPRVGYRAAWLLSWIAYHLLANRRRVMRANYAPVVRKPVDHPDLDRLGKQAFQNFGRYLYEFLCFPYRTIDEIDRQVVLHISDDLAQACRSGKGVIFVSAHFGNMDYTAVSVVKHIMPMTVVADFLEPQKLMDRLVHMRGQKGVRVVYRARAARAVVEALKRNEAVGFLVDVGYNRKGGIPVTFFGRRTMFPAGPARLALRTGAPVVVGYAVATNGRIEAYSYPPIYAVSTGDKEADARLCCQMMASYFEDFIQRYPDQWYIFRPMWGAEPVTESLSVPDEAAVKEPLVKTA